MGFPPNKGSCEVEPRAGLIVVKPAAEGFYPALRPPRAFLLGPVPIALDPTFGSFTLLEPVSH
jgi:hypothetical protein